MPEEKQIQKRKTPPDLSRLVEPGAAAKKSAHVPEKKAAKEFIVENEGGKKVSRPVPEKEVRFDHLGAKVVRRSPYFLHLPDPSAAPAESEADEDNES